MFHFSASRDRGRRQAPTISTGEPSSHGSLEDVKGKNAGGQEARKQSNKAKGGAEGDAELDTVT